MREFIEALGSGVVRPENETQEHTGKDDKLRRFPVSRKREKTVSGNIQVTIDLPRRIHTRFV